MSREVERAWRVRGLRTALCTEKNEEKESTIIRRFRALGRYNNRREAWVRRAPSNPSREKVASAKNG